MALCIIPARGGSKRIPRKNIKPFCGRPMIAHSIQTASESGCFDRIIISTDDDEIASIAREYGAEIPFMRPAELSDDYTGTADVIAHAIMALAPYRSEYVCCLYATAPFVQTADLLRGYAQIKDNSNTDYAFSVTTFPFPIQRALRLDTHGSVSMFSPENFSVRSQDLEESWHDAGQFYWGTAAAWLEKQPIFNSRSQAVILPRYRVQDIDTEEDWQRAELLYRVLQQNGEYR